MNHIWMRSLFETREFGSMGFNERVYVFAICQ